MTYHNTLTAYLKKCQEAHDAIVAKRKEEYDQIVVLEQARKEQRDQLLVVSGQIAALEALLDPDINHAVELPFAGDDIEELHDKRLEGQDGLDQDEVRKFREQHAYLRESTGIVEQIHEANEGTGADASAGSGADAEADS
jgi:hypothetical protein